MSTSDQVEHGAEELKGEAKSGVGDALGNEQMEAEGKQEEASADAKQAADKVEDDTDALKRD